MARRCSVTDVTVSFSFSLGKLAETGPRPCSLLHGIPAIPRIVSWRGNRQLLPLSLFGRGISQERSSRGFRRESAGIRAKSMGQISSGSFPGDRAIHIFFCVTRNFRDSSTKNQSSRQYPFWTRACSSLSTSRAKERWQLSIVHLTYRLPRRTRLRRGTIYPLDRRVAAPRLFHCNAVASARFTQGCFRKF